MPRFDPPHYLMEHDGTRLREAQHALVNARGHYLGAVSAKGVTIDYYASPATLRWSSNQMKALHDKLVAFDIDFQKTVKNVAGTIKPFLGLVRAVGIKANDDDIDELAKLPAVTAGAALLLEVAFGGRKVDNAFFGILQLISSQLIAGTTILTIASSACIAIGSAGVVAAGTGVVLLSVGGVLGTTALICGLVGVVLGNLAKKEMPSRADYGSMMKASAQLAGEPIPSEAQIDIAYAATESAFRATGLVKGSKRSPAFDAAVRAKAEAAAAKIARDKAASGKQSRAQSSNSNLGGTSPLLIGGAVLAALFILKKGSKA